MGRTRLVAAFAATAIIAAGPLAVAGLASAADAPTGVGSSAVGSTVLSVQLGANGDLLSVRVLGDDGTSTIDPAKGTPVSSETLSPLTVTSKTVPALNVSAPTVSTKSSGVEDKKSVQPALPSVPAFKGSVNAILSSVVDTAGARSGLKAGLADLSLAGGLVSVPTGLVQVATDAAKTAATGQRTVEIPSINVLDLSAVLDGLGLSLDQLPLHTILDLVKSLGLPIPDVPDPAAAVASLNSAIDQLRATVGSTVTPALCNTVNGLVGQLPVSLPQTVATPVGGLPNLVTGTIGGISVPGVLSAAATLNLDCNNITQTVQQLLDQVQHLLADLLGSLLANLGSTPLLSVQNVKVGMVAKAADTVGHSVADVTASIGSVKVGALTVPAASGLDLTDTAAVLNQATSAIQSAVSGVLDDINSALANMVKVDVLQITKGVTSSGGYTKAASAITALKATITPPTGLLSAAAVDPNATVGSVIAGLGGTVPALAPAMGQLETALGGLQALTGQSTVSVGQLTADAAFRPVAAIAGPGTTPGTLPRTGGNAALPAMAGVALGGLALAIRRLLRSSNTAA